MSHLLSIVIPAYREEKNISYIYQELLRVLDTSLRPFFTR